MQRLRARERSHRREFLMITGHAGIGKTFFIYYALARCLQEHIPVVICLDSSDSCLFDADGPREIDTTMKSYRNLSEDTIVLYNSDWEMNGAFIGLPRIPAFAVHVTTIDAKHWEALDKDAYPVIWIMGLNTREEVAQLQALQERETPKKCGWLEHIAKTERTYTPVEVFDLLGPCIRVCEHHSCTYTSDNLGTQGARYILDRLESGGKHYNAYALLSMMLNHDHYNILDRFFFAHPLHPQGDPRTAFRLHPFSLGFSVPTLFLRQQLAAAFREMALKDQLRFADAFSGSPQIANALFEPLVLDALERHPRGHWCHVLGRAVGDRTADFRLGPGLVLERITDKALFRLGDNRVYVPLPGTLPGISAVVVSEDAKRATLLHLDIVPTPNRQDWPTYKRVGGRKISKRAVCDAIDLFPAEQAREMKWSLLLPTTKDQGRNVKVKGDMVLPEGYPKVDIGWMRVGGSWELLEVLHLFRTSDGDELEITAEAEGVPTKLLRW
ncbi:hypothetical protein L226DRAFT_292902 [Lentinus tigrinus ALCF2SS1-7]|uniref:uncharacterized protein n=1 Tax=Lentinus tigrinus ALCF2SS1-7 TaxID=1328758 RepID=UPI001165C90F|nr:hypothetical protein L226DRAFT_292902 [Lentinus tigrinus ALCF2SS1-7]